MSSPEQGERSAVPYVIDGLNRLDLDGDVLLFDGDMLHRLTGTAAEVFLLIDGATTLASIVDVLCARHHAPQHVVRPDVEALVEDLVGQGVVTLEPAHGGHSYSRPDHVAHVRDGDHVVLADLRTGARSALSATGSLVWERACEGSDTDGVVASVLAGREDDTAAAQVVALLHELCEIGLLERRG